MKFYSTIIAASLILTLASSAHANYSAGKRLMDDYDFSGAKIQFLKSASSDSRSAYKLASIYNLDAHRDYDKAFKYAKKASQMGEVDAYLMMSNLYRDGKGVSSSNVHSIKWVALFLANFEGDSFFIKAATIGMQKTLRLIDEDELALVKKLLAKCTQKMSRCF